MIFLSVMLSSNRNIALRQLKRKDFYPNPVIESGSGDIMIAEGDDALSDQYTLKKTRPSLSSRSSSHICLHRGLFRHGAGQEEWNRTPAFG